MNEEDGVWNVSADLVDRVDETWSDTNLDRDYDKPQPSYVYKKIPRLVCNYCHSNEFEVLRTADYETTAQCIGCGRYFIVHSG